MRGGTHLAIGIAAGIAATATLNLSLPIVIIAAAMGSIAPDIDHPNSLISRRVRPLAWLFGLFGHRTLTHSAIALAGLALGLGRLTLYPYDHLFFIGYALHIAADALTVRGVRFFYPLQIRVKLLPFSITALEPLLILICAGLSTMILISQD